MSQMSKMFAMPIILDIADILAISAIADILAILAIADMYYLVTPVEKSRIILVGLLESFSVTLDATHCNFNTGSSISKTLVRGYFSSEQCISIASGFFNSTVIFVLFGQYTCWCLVSILLILLEYYSSDGRVEERPPREL